MSSLLIFMDKKERLNIANINYEQVKELIQGKLIDRTLDVEYEDLSEVLFGEGNCFNSSEVRKRMYGMKRLIEIIEGDETFEDFQNIKTRILSISDLHYPFHKDISIFKEYVGKVDVLQLNGDLIDCTQLSSFNKTFRTSPIEEMIGVRQYLIDLIEMIKPKRVVVNYGNHELRLGAYLAKNIDNEIQELMPETALDYIFIDGFTHYDRRTKAKIKYEPLVDVFEDIDINYTGTWWSQIGKTIFAHPRTFSSVPMKTAEKAAIWFRNEGADFDSLIMSHTHRVGFYKIGNTSIYEQGACCETDKMLYNDGNLINSQKQGFMYICQDSEGRIIPTRTKMIALN